MKCVRGLTDVALVSFLSFQPGVAMSKVVEQVPSPTSSSQTEPVIMANLLRDIQRGVQIGEQVNRTRLREQRRQEAEKRRQEAIERRRLEAERQRQYFESLSPAEKEAYLAKQRARQAQNAEAAAALMMLLFGGGSGSTQQGDDDRVCRNQRQVGVNDFETMTARQARGYGLVCN